MRSRCGSYQACDAVRFRPARRLALAQRAIRRGEIAPSRRARRGGGANAASAQRRIRAVGHARRAAAPAVAGPMPGHQLQHAEAGDAVARVFDQAQHRQHVLDVRGLEEFQPAEFHEGNVAPGQFDFQRRAVVRGAEQHRLRLQRACRPRAAPAPARPRSAPGPPRRARVTSCGCSAGRRARSTASW